MDHLQPQCCTEPYMLGIDEAGRGPVLGPMVYACALSPISKSDDLRVLGLADSKTLTEHQRESLLARMLQHTDWLVGAVRVISPWFITEKMLGRCKTSLNVISHDAAIGLIQAALDKAVNVKEVYVDTVGKAEHYEAKLQALFPKLKICVESKADDTYPIVSAASIFAKVTRDRLLQLWPMNERGPVSDSLPVGSGYPGDPLTKHYLRQCVDPLFGFPSLVRSSWSTARTILEKSGVKITWDDDEDQEKALDAKHAARKRVLTEGSYKLDGFYTIQERDNKKASIRQSYFIRSALIHVDKFS
ncbi:hypothetical protein CRM22_002648 [Opisthorchis felineus]|uniref:Ribonuclease n=1 Tax=Opisthorchis felineus TaxID=147828 RepID=A0A4S2M510_OPIFE|nr:hypothetical protein CRM22_002648 [Opisthorchis felineus]